MKVILTAEVKGKGHEGDVVEVARGYAVNYLLPRKMAIEATAGNIKQLDARMVNIRKRNAARLSDAESIAASIDGKSVKIEAKAGVDGKLFGSVTALMIEEAVAAQLGADVDHKRMNLHRPIKTAGQHEILVGVYGDVKATLIVNVVSEGVPGAPEVSAVEQALEAAKEEAVSEAPEAPEAPEVPEEPAAEVPAEAAVDAPDDEASEEETAAEPAEESDVEGDAD